MLFSAELPWCYFCAEIKVLGMTWNFTENIFGINKKYWRKKHHQGPTPCPRGWRARPLPRGPPGSPPMPIFWYKVSFSMEKIRRKLSGRSAAVSRRNQSRAPAELFCRGNIPPGGRNHRHHHHHRSSHREGVNLHQHLHQHHLLSNPSPSLVSDLCLKTSDWYLWVASSVDYSL